MNIGTRLQTQRDPGLVELPLQSSDGRADPGAVVVIEAREDVWRARNGLHAVGNERSIVAREDGAVPPGRAVDVIFRELMGDTFGELRSIYAQLGLELTDDAVERMQTFLADNPSDKHGVHTYTFSATELDEDATRARMVRYEQFFAVPRERLG